MKKIFAVILLCCVIAVCCKGDALTTRITSYRTLNSVANAASDVDDDLTAAAGYSTSAISGEIDLKELYGSGYETYANGVVMIVNATGAADGDTLTQKLYGRVDQGPPQLIASIVWTIGTARADGSTATYLWADDAAMTEYHLRDLTEADGDGSDRVCSVSFDACGYRYLYSIFTAQTGDPTLCKVLYRVY